MNCFIRSLVVNDSYLSKHVQIPNQLADLKISGISADSKHIKPDFLFVAKKGACKNSKDGHDFINDAIKHGASVVVVDKNHPQTNYYPVPIIRADDSQRAYAYLCEAFFDYPSKKLSLIGLTGTNGKTSTSFILHALLKHAGFKPHIMGTLGLGEPGNLIPLTHTTMEAEFISASLAQLVRSGISHLILEVSSHALMLDRVAALNFAAVGLTNITHDHLDFHKTLENYYRAKRRLFFDVANTHSYKILPTANPWPEASSLTKLSFYGEYSLADNLNLLGDFHRHNASLAIAIAKIFRIDDQTIKHGLTLCQPIPGRLQQIINEPCPVFVDFAHTPDALQSVLNNLRKLQPHNIILVFGCGGDRDALKRPLMGNISAKLADIVIITDDNPRSEPAHLIRHAILAELKHHPKAYEIANRHEAIKQALDLAKPKDIVLVAGKGHENYQIYGQEKTYFSDEEEIKKFFGK